MCPDACRLSRWLERSESQDSRTQGLRSRAHEQKRSGLSDHIYRITEVVGSSSESVQQAIRNGVERASRTLRMVEWFEVTEIRGRVDAGQVERFQVA